MKLISIVIVILLAATLQSQAPEWRYMYGHREAISIADDGDKLWVSVNLSSPRYLPSERSHSFQGEYVVYNKNMPGNKIHYNCYNSGIPKGEISDIFTDVNGNKWFSTWGGGIAVYNNSSWTVYNKYNSPLSDSLVNFTVVSPKGTVWVSTKSGVFRKEGNNWTYLTPFNSGIPSQKVYAIAIDSIGNTWFGTDNGLGKFDGANWTLYTTSNSGLPKNIILSLEAGSGNTLWVGTQGGGVAKFSNNVWTVFNDINPGFGLTSAFDMALDKAGNLWVVHGVFGILMYDGTNWTQHDVFNNSTYEKITSVSADKDNSVWVGGNLGVYRFNGGAWIHYPVNNTPVEFDYIISAAFRKPDELWFGTYGGIIHRKDGIYTTYPGNPYSAYRNAFDILAEVNNITWFATQNGLLRFDGNNWTLYTKSNSGLPSDALKCLKRDKTGVLWIGTIDGLVKLENNNWTVYNRTNSQIVSNYIRFIAVDKNNVKWIGTADGVSRFDGTDWTSYTTSNSQLPHNAIVGLGIDSSNNKWIATEQGGIAKFNDQSWSIYKTLNNIQISTTKSLAIDRNSHVWITATPATGPFYMYFAAKYDGSAWKTFTHNNSGIIEKTQKVYVDDYNNKWIPSGDIIVIHREGGVVSTREELHEVHSFTLEQNYPNPFNPATTIKYKIAEAGNVTLKVYDILGKEITTLFNGYRSPGEYTEIFNATGISSGVYFYQVKTASYTETKKMILLR